MRLLYAPLGQVHASVAWLHSTKGFLNKLLTLLRRELFEGLKQLDCQCTHKGKWNLLDDAANCTAIFQRTALLTFDLNCLVPWCMQSSPPNPLCAREIPRSPGREDVRSRKLSKSIRTHL